VIVDLRLDTYFPVHAIEGAERDRALLILKILKYKVGDLYLICVKLLM
jgi:hypothetical protein